MPGNRLQKDENDDPEVRRNAVTSIKFASLAIRKEQPDGSSVKLLLGPANHS